MRPDKRALKIIRQGGVWVPSPLALRENKYPDEAYQRLLTLYYIKSGARAVIPGAHTGEFAGCGYISYPKHLELFNWWLGLIKELTITHGKGMFLMAMVSGIKQAELAAKHGYHMATVSPRAFKGLNDRQKISYCKDIASVIPVFGFYLQTKAGGVELSPEFWREFFKFGWGAKFAPFDRYRTLKALETASMSKRLKELTFVTGNDDHIITDLMHDFNFNGNKLRIKGGLLGHYATDTHAAVKWTEAALNYGQSNRRKLKIAIEDLSDAVTLCNDALFDASPNNFANSIWGVKCRLTQLGLLKGPFCFAETGRKDMSKEITRRYEGKYSVYLSDREWLETRLPSLKKEAGVK
ncbi:MAG: hypothetical protein WCI43_03245 [Candidatus Firestonebacteria bacterium]